MNSMLTCFQCGTCTASCPSGNLNVRRIVRDSVRKDVSDELDLWMCTTCYTCMERCPRGINVTDEIFRLRSQAVRKGKMLPAHRKVCRYLVETGHAIPLDDVHRAVREKIGLVLPENPKALREVKTLLKSTGFDELIKE